MGLRTSVLFGSDKGGPDHSGHPQGCKTKRSHVLHMSLYASFLRIHVYNRHQKLCFFSQESYSKADVDPPTGKRLDVGMSGLEGRVSAEGRGGFFEKGLVAALESSRHARGVYREVEVVTTAIHIVCQSYTS